MKASWRNTLLYFERAPKPPRRDPRAFGELSSQRPSGQPFWTATRGPRGLARRRLPEGRLGRHGNDSKLGSAPCGAFPRFFFFFFFLNAFSLRSIFFLPGLFNNGAYFSACVLCKDTLSSHRAPVDASVRLRCVYFHRSSMRVVRRSLQRHSLSHLSRPSLWKL